MKPEVNGQDIEGGQVHVDRFHREVRLLPRLRDVRGHGFVPAVFNNATPRVPTGSPLFLVGKMWGKTCKKMKQFYISCQAGEISWLGQSTNF